MTYECFTCKKDFQRAPSGALSAKVFCSRTCFRIEFKKSFHQTNPNSLAQMGKRKGIKHSTETKNKISEAKKGSRASKETREKMSKSQLGNTYALGYRHTQEAREKISESKSGKIPYKMTDAIREKISKTLASKKGNSYKYPEEVYENKLRSNRRRMVLRLSGGGTHTLQDWLDLKKKFNYMCLCCKKQEPEVTLSEDHIVPLTLNGSDNIENIQPLCRSCNSRKYNKIINFIIPFEKIKMGNKSL